MLLTQKRSLLTDDIGVSTFLFTNLCFVLAVHLCPPLQAVHSNLLGRDDDVYILGTTVLKTYYTVRAHTTGITGRAA